MEREINFSDFLKGNLTVLVIVGHCMLFGFFDTLEKSYVIESNYFYRVIYSFHMPLFMAISGYYSYYSISKYKLYVIIKKRFKQLLLPLMILSLATTLNQINNDYFNLVFFKFFNNFWFGWAVFYFTILIYLTENKIKNYYFYFVIIVFLCFIKLPNVEVIKFELLFFMIGYYYNKSNFNYLNNIEMKYNKKFIFCFSVMCLLVLSYFYSSRMPIHITGVFDEFTLKNIEINIIRWIIGVLNSIFYVCIMKIVYMCTRKWIKKFFCYLGQKSYLIYIIHCYIVQGFLTKIAFKYTLNFHMLTLVIETVLVLLCTMVIVFLLTRGIYFIKRRYKI